LAPGFCWSSYLLTAWEGWGERITSGKNKENKKPRHFFFFFWGGLGVVPPPPPLLT